MFHVVKTHKYTLFCRFSKQTTKIKSKLYTRSKIKQWKIISMPTTIATTIWLQHHKKSTSNVGGFSLETLIHWLLRNFSKGLNQLPWISIGLRVEVWVEKIFNFVTAQNQFSLTQFVCVWVLVNSTVFSHWIKRIFDFSGGDIKKGITKNEK